MPDMNIALRIVPAGNGGEDRASVVSNANGHVFVVADGAGGTSGGGAAADVVIERAGAALLMGASDCVRLLSDVDRALTDVGETTAVVLVIAAGRVFGASVGDSSAWLIDAGNVNELTENQCRKPLLGSGHAVATPFGPLDFRGRILIGSDGLFKYTQRERIRHIVATLPVASAADELVAAVRLPSGALQDDVAVIVASR